MILGLGTDLVHIPSFASQFEAVGTTFKGAFTGAELRAVKAKSRVSGFETSHLAARWAAKEAFIKAWSSALFGHEGPIPVEELVWSEIEVISDKFGRPGIRLNGRVLEEFTGSLPSEQSSLLLSMSHDGDYATATVVIS